VGFWRKAVTKVARGALDATGRAIKGALFGDQEPAANEEDKPDPFAKLKAAEKEERERERASKRRK
jgi:hypothetical protein